MSTILQAAASTAIGLVGSLALLNLAGAQEATETPSTTAPAAEAPATPGQSDERDCPEKHASEGRSDSSATTGTSA